MKCLSLFHLALFAILLLFVSGCTEQNDQFSQVSNTPENMAHGEQVYSKYQCYSCHELQGYQTSNTNEYEINTEKVALGGAVSQQVSFSYLITSIISPSHQFIRMQHYNAVQSSDTGNSPFLSTVMNINELVDLSVFLKNQYEVKAYTSFNQYDSGFQNTLSDNPKLTQFNRYHQGYQQGLKDQDTKEPNN